MSKNDSFLDWYNTAINVSNAQRLADIEHHKRQSLQAQRETAGQLDELATRYQELININAEQARLQAERTSRDERLAALRQHIFHVEGLLEKVADIPHANTLTYVACELVEAHFAARGLNESVFPEFADKDRMKQALKFLSGKKKIASDALGAEATKEAEQCAVFIRGMQVIEDYKVDLQAHECLLATEREIGQAVKNLGPAQNNLNASDLDKRIDDIKAEIRRELSRKDRMGPVAKFVLGAGAVVAVLSAVTTGNWIGSLGLTSIYGWVLYKTIMYLIPKAKKDKFASDRNAAPQRVTELEGELNAAVLEQNDATSRRVQWADLQARYQSASRLVSESELRVRSRYAQLWETLSSSEAVHERIENLKEFVVRKTLHDDSGERLVDTDVAAFSALLQAAVAQQEWQQLKSEHDDDDDDDDDNENYGGGNDDMGSDPDADPLYDEAVAFVMESRRPSISFVQRKFKIGYNRAARLIESMEMAGIVTPMQSNGQREVIVPGRE